MKPSTVEELSAEQRREIAAWIDAHQADLPDSVRIFLSLHHPYLAADGDPRKALDAAWRELRRALHLTPSSEKRRTSGSPLADIPRAEPVDAKNEREVIEARMERSDRLAAWHCDLNKQHHERSDRLAEKLAKMSTDDSVTKKPEEIVRLEDIELTKEDREKSRQAGAQFVAHLLEGSGADPAMKSMTETLMPGSSVLVGEEHASLPAKIPENLADARVVKTMTEQRVRYDFSVAVTRVELDVEKKVVIALWDEATGRVTEALEELRESEAPIGDRTDLALSGVVGPLERSPSIGGVRKLATSGTDVRRSANSVVGHSDSERCMSA